MGEPATTAKIRLNTTKGEINVELWCKECPSTTGWFLNLFHDDKFKDISIPSFERNEYVQMFVDCENKDDSNSEIIAQLNKETNQRLRFTKRGLLCFGSFTDRKQKAKLGFFITLKPMPIQNGKYTIFGKITDQSIYNVIRISESEIDEDSGMPIYPTKILDFEVLVAYFKEQDLRTASNKGQEASEGMTKSQLLPHARAKRQVKLVYDDDDEEEDEGFVVKMKPMAERKTKRKESLKKGSSGTELSQNNSEAHNVSDVIEKDAEVKNGAEANEKGVEVKEKGSEVKAAPVDDKEARDMWLFEAFDKKLASSAVDQDQGSRQDTDREDSDEEENTDFMSHRVEFV